MSVKQILVSGDFVLDNHIYEGRRSHYGDNTSVGVNVVTQTGGAALVHQLLEELVKPRDDKTEQTWQSICGVNMTDNPAEQAYAFWRPYPEKKGSNKLFWRVSEAMGFGPAEAVAKCKEMPPVDISGSPEIVVCSEGGMGFRECQENWHAEKLDNARWIVLKTTSPVAKGSLWEHLSGKYADKLIVIVSAQELRKSPARMNAGLSWEETVEGLLREVGPKGRLEALARCCHLIVAFESEGALWLDLSNGFGAARACLSYESGTFEGEHSHGTDGSAFGFLSCLAAAVTWSLACAADTPDFASALEGGLAAMRDLRERGHGPAKDVAAGFPASRLAGVIKAATMRYSRALFLTNDPEKYSSPESASPWSFIRQAQRGDGPLFDLARLVLLRGPIALDSLPHLQIGNLLTADRSEIESLRTLTQVIRRYQNKREPGKKPLSLGVFGPPGAGKSFAVKELANSLVKNIGWMEFNLSQFDSPDDLNGAFHQIRDHVLQGRLPVAFFDEFDSREYHWLQYLLAPMQDGKFQEGQLTHTLGKCIFVFAGGTSPTFETFGPPKDLADDKETELQQKFRLAKGPDFKSRLDAYLNVLGPNQRQIPLETIPEYKEDVEMIGGRAFMVDQSDIVFPVRRALMARAQLKCNPDDKLQMDEGLVHALLHVGKYTHGNRSLEKVLQPFAVARPSCLHSSLLMPAAQLAMHTDKDTFITLCGNAPEPFSPQAPLTVSQIEKIAPAISETYRALGRKEGWGKPETDKDFKDLSEFFQNSNRKAATRMLWLLAHIGLTLEEGVASKAEEDLVKQHLEFYLLALSEAEHEGWMDWHVSEGWRYDEKRDDEKRLHNCLQPFTKLNDKEKGKDRDSIRHYPDFAREAGMKIVFSDISVE